MSVEEYYQLKKQLMPDWAIAEKWFISLPTLYRWKRKNNIKVGQIVQQYKFKPKEKVL